VSGDIFRVPRVIFSRQLRPTQTKLLGSLPQPQVNFSQPLQTASSCSTPHFNITTPLQSRRFCAVRSIYIDFYNASFTYTCSLAGASTYLNEQSGRSVAAGSCRFSSAAPTSSFICAESTVLVSANPWRPVPPDNNEYSKARNEYIAERNENIAECNKCIAEYGPSSPNPQFPSLDTDWFHFASQQCYPPKHYTSTQLPNQ